jgi:hypothetical protein
LPTVLSVTSSNPDARPPARLRGQDQARAGRASRVGDREAAGQRRAGPGEAAALDKAGRDTLPLAARFFRRDLGTLGHRQSGWVLRVWCRAGHRRRSDDLGRARLNPRRDEIVVTQRMLLEAVAEWWAGMPLAPFLPGRFELPREKRGAACLGFCRVYTHVWRRGRIVRVRIHSSRGGARG